MAFRDRFAWMGGRRAQSGQPQQPRQPRNQIPASHQRTVNVPGRSQQDVADYDQATNAPWNRVGHHEEFKVQRVVQGSEWGAPQGQNPEAGQPDVMVASSTSNPSRPRTRQLGYSYEDSVLTVTFRDGATYRYEDVTPSKFSQLQHAWSTGKTMNSMNLDGHEYMRVS